MKLPAVGLLLLLLVAHAAAQAVAPDDPLVIESRKSMVLRQVNELYEAGDYDAASQRLAALPGSVAQAPDALNMRAAIYTKLGRYDEARLIFKNILDADPDYFPAYFNLGEVQFVQGDFVGALETFRTIARREPRNELVRFKIFICHLKLGQEDEARKIADKLIPAGSTPAWYYAQATLARLAGDSRLADKHLVTARTIYGEKVCQFFDESIQPLKF